MYPKFIRAALVCALAFGTPYTAAASANNENTIVIRRDDGGKVIEYAKAVSKAREANTQVKFQGRCASSCTMFLSLDPSQTCITPNASFLFHRAYGAKSDMNSWSTKYMQDRYPAWVKNWIASKGGLSNRLIRMNYKYASQFIRSCDSA